MRLNYRTTEEILRWSLALLTGSDYDDLDSGRESLAGYRSTFHGPPPELRDYPHRADEFEGLAETVRGWLAGRAAPGEVGVAARTRKLAEEAAARLTAADIDATELDRDEADRKGIHVGTMHRMKGLEFRCVAVVGAEVGTLPLPYALCDPTIDRVQHDRDLQRERSLLFVACTRARDVLRISWTGRPSPFLPSGDE